MPRSSYPSLDAEPNVVEEPPEPRGLRRPLPLYWKGFTVALALCGVGGAALLVLAPHLSGLFLLTLYSAPSNSVVPIPHEPGLLYFAKYYEPALVAVAATIGTCTMAFIDYDLVKRALGHPKLDAVHRSRWFKTAARWMVKAPVITVAVFAGTPLPVMVVRVLAPASGVPIARYIIGLAIGRLPRYFVFAMIGRALDLPGWVILLALVVLIALMVWASRRAQGELPAAE